MVCGNVAVRLVGDAKNVSEAAVVEGFQTSELLKVYRPILTSIEEGREAVSYTHLTLPTKA